jgi:hypothetical protein
MVGCDAGPGAIIGAIATIPPNPPEATPDSVTASTPIVSLAADVLGGGMTSPLAIAAAFLASTSAFEGRPRFFGCCAVGGVENARGEPFEDGFGWIRIILSAPD